MQVPIRRIKPMLLGKTGTHVRLLLVRAAGAHFYSVTLTRGGEGGGGGGAAAAAAAAGTNASCSHLSACVNSTEVQILTLKALQAEILAVKAANRPSPPARTQRVRGRAYRRKKKEKSLRRTRASR
jgi:hypothetical protein